MLHLPFPALCGLVLCLCPMTRGDFAPDGISSLWADAGERAGRVVLRGGWERTGENPPVFRRVLPEPGFPDAVLVVANPGCDRLEVFWNDRLVYGFGSVSGGPFALRAANAAHWIVLPEDGAGGVLELRLVGGSVLDPGEGRPMTVVASATALTRELQRMAAPRIALAMLFVIVGLYAGMAWAVRRRYGSGFSPWLSVVALSLGLALLAAAAMEFLPPAAAAGLYSPALLLMLLFPAALWRFMEESLGRGRWSLIRRCWQLQLVSAACLWLPDALGWRPFAAPAQMLGNSLIALQLAVGLMEGVRFSTSDDASRRWTARGILLFSLAALVDIGVSAFTGNPDFELYPLGLAALIAILAANQERAAGEAQRTLRRQAEELREHRDHLEERVRERTEQLREATRAAEAASRAKSGFLANMSHEVRTPLNAILGHARFLARDGDGAVRERAEVIHHGAEHLLTLINDILDLSRIEAGRFSPEPVETDLPGLLDGLMGLLAPRAEEKGLALHVEALTPLPATVRVDERRVRQVLLNLLGNAVKFTREGGGWLRVAHRGDHLEFEVEDSGPGMAAEDVERLFAPFERDATARSVEGTGLGLAISRELARALGGELTAESRPGEGSVFRFRCPAPRIADREAAAPVPPPSFSRPAVPRPDPLPPDYAELLEAARIGDVAAFPAAIHGLREAYPEHGPFLDHLARLAGAFDLEGIQAALDPEGVRSSGG